MPVAVVRESSFCVFLDDYYVSKTEISDIEPGDAFRCTLGMDTSIQVSNTFTETSEISAQPPFVEQYTTNTYASTVRFVTDTRATTPSTSSRNPVSPSP